MQFTFERIISWCGLSCSWPTRSRSTTTSRWLRFSTAPPNQERLHRSRAGARRRYVKTTFDGVTANFRTFSKEVSRSGFRMKTWWPATSWSGPRWTSCRRTTARRRSTVSLPSWMTTSALHLLTDCRQSARQVQLPRFTFRCFWFENLSRFGPQGDSGGALIVDQMVVGIVSWSKKPCGEFPGVFSSVPAHFDWIREKSGLDYL